MRIFRHVLDAEAFAILEKLYAIHVGVNPDGDQLAFERRASSSVEICEAPASLSTMPGKRSRCPWGSRRCQSPPYCELMLGHW